MQSKDKERVEQAKRRNGGNSNTTVDEDGYNRAQQRGEFSGAGTKQDLDEIGDQLGDSWSDYVQFRAFNRMLGNLQTGKRGDDLQQFVTAVKYGVGRAIASTKAEIGQELDPKYLMASNSELTPTSTESFWDEPTTATVEVESESQ